MGANSAFRVTHQNSLNLPAQFLTCCLNLIVFHNQVCPRVSQYGKTRHATQVKPTYFKSAFGRRWCHSVLSFTDGAMGCSTNPHSLYCRAPEALLSLVPSRCSFSPLFRRHGESAWARKDRLGRHGLTHGSYKGDRIISVFISALF